MSENEQTRQLIQQLVNENNHLRNEVNRLSSIIHERDLKDE